MKKLFFMAAILLAVSCIFISCDRQPQTDVITVEDGYLVVNGNKTEHKVDVGGAVTENGGKDEADKDDADKDETVITVEDGYLVVDGVKTEYKVDKAAVITVEDGYLVVDGVKTEYKVDKAAVVTVEDGYLVVDGVKTEYEVELTCDHVWETVTTPPTCTEGGYDTKTCTVCEKRVRTNVTEAKAHDYSRGFQLDNDYHWLECAVCEEVSDHAEHTLDDEGICSVCQLPVAATPGVVYDLAGDGTYALVIGYEGSATKVKIAEEYEGRPVTGIYGEAFSNTSITAVVIPDSVTSIGGSAFSWCSSLASVTIGDSVTSIGYSAFEGCSSLASVTIGNSVTSIGGEAFSWCSSLASVTIPDSVTSIGASAFYSCDSLTSVTIPDSVTSIGADAFSGCSSLASVTIPDSVTSIGDSAFSGCNSALYTEYEFCKYVKSGENPYAVLIEVTNQNMSSYTIHEDAKIIAVSVFSWCDRLSSIEIPDGVTSIGAAAFYSCSSLTSVTIPDSVTSIGDSAFYSCDSLTTVTIGNGVTSIGWYAFEDCSSLASVYYGGGERDWSDISIGDYNWDLTSATRYDYSETQPTADGNYWRFVDGVPTAW